MKNSLKISAILASMFIALSANSQSDSLGMPGDDLDLRAVLSIFKQSSSIEDFEKKLNSADTKVNNLDLNNDNQVDYLRVVDYGKDDFHSIVIQDPVSKSESQDVAVIAIVKKGDNTAHIQITGDETLYGKDYIIEPKDQAPLNSSSKKENIATDDVYQSANDDNNTQVMINVWAWPSVSYIYSPGYAYWVSPWYWGYYPGWYSPWRPYGWHAYHHGFVGYNYGFYGYRRYHHAYPHVHNHYYGRRVSSGYVQKNAPNYGRRRDASYNNAQKIGQPRTNGPRDQNRSRTRTNTSGSNPAGRTGTQKERTNSGRSQSGRTNTTGEQKNTNKGENRSNQRSGGQRTNQSNTNQRSSQNQGSQRVNSAPRNSGGGGAGQSGGGGRSNSGGGGGRSSGGAGGGGRK